jgi:hypothetical protein
MKTSPNFRTFLIALLLDLEHSGCNPIILRNYDGLPDEIGNDLDIFVQPVRLKAAESVFISLASNAGAQILHRHTRSYFSAIWLRFSDSDECYHFDLYPGAGTWHGIQFLSAEELIAGRLGWNNYMIPRPAHEAAISALSSWLWGGFFKQHYIQCIRGLLKDGEERHEFIRLIEQCFGLPLGRVIVDQIENDPVSNALALTSAMRNQLCMRSFRRSPIASVCAWAHYWIGELKCVFLPPGCVIALDRAIIEEGTIVENLRSQVGFCFGGVHLIESDNTLMNLLNSRKFIAKNYLVISHTPIHFANCLDFTNASSAEIQQLGTIVMQRLKKQLTSR